MVEVRWKRESEKKGRKVTSEIPKGKLHIFLPCFILMCSGTVNQYNMFITVFQSFGDNGLEQREGKRGKIQGDRVTVRDEWQYWK